MLLTQIGADRFQVTKVTGDWLGAITTYDMAKY